MMQYVTIRYTKTLEIDRMVVVTAFLHGTLNGSVYIMQVQGVDR